MDLTGKTIVLTGASSGAGAEAARLLSARGAALHLVGRDEKRTRAIGEELRAPTYTADFTSLSQTRGLAARLAHAVPNIDVLALNAGGVMPPCLTDAGIDASFQANALAPWLLMTQLAGQLGTGRVLLTNSRSHNNAVLSPNNLDAALAGEPRVSGHRTYARAKLAAGVLLREFHRRNPGVDAGDFHPGIMASDFGRYMGRTGSLLKTAARPFIGTPRQGAERLVDLATRQQALDGAYFVRTRPARGSAQLHSQELGTALWEAANRATAA
ncbi:SDR family NAD(P)-dependent oxidoreductase [Streptomyces sp. 110]|uniref:SDR family NAD(P)-dependent oxidoreductase n=1 Tax=Streptomyces endocoffeicus TaxID=2898945 RepID=A0ABS1PLB9_9ACTN|nr:SDR family NAD(P)-dependent oxidoreductase [Streptomyces endocoffeicus]MBL1112780.1 SDR family NAD(P)-dependent oxidoreductase [Streptomyces endocoffeicus]